MEEASEGRSVIERIGAVAVSMTPTRKDADFPLVLAYVKDEANRLEQAVPICRRSAILLLEQFATVPLLALVQ